MAKPWSDVERSDAYRAMNPSQQAEAKRQYFQEVVTQKPEYKGLPKQEKKAAEEQFFGKRQYEGFEAPVAAVKNFVPSLRKFGTGVAQAVIHPVESTKAVGGVLGGAFLHGLDPNKMLGILPSHRETVSAVVNKLSGDPQAARKLMDTASAMGGVYVEQYGTPERIERTFAEDPVAFATDVASILSGGAGVAANAGLAGTTKTLSTASRVLNPLEVGAVAGQGLQKAGNALATKGAPKALTSVVGAAGHAVEWTSPEKHMNALAKGAAKGVEVSKNAFAPKEKAWLAATNADGVNEGQRVIDAAKDKMAKGKVEIVPGSKPTIAEVVSDLKLPRLSQFDQAAKKRLDTTAARRQMDNEAAQVAHVGKVAKTEKDIVRAKALRSLKADPLYKVSKGKTAKADDKLFDLLGRPSMDRVMARAKRIAAEKDIDFQTGENIPAHTVKSSVLGPNGKPLTINVPDQFANYTGENLLTIKKAFDDEIKEIKAQHQPGVETEELRAIYDTRDNFINWFESKIPEQKAANDTYKKLSEPIAQMKVGQFIKGKLEGAHGEDASALRSTVFENALKDAPGTVKKSTGQRYVQKLDDIFTPGQMKIVNEVQEDIRRSELNKRLAKFGRGNDPNLRTTATDAVADANSPSFLNARATLIRSTVDRLKAHFDEKMATRIAAELIAEDLNIPIAAIEKAMAHEAKVKRTTKNVENVGRGIGKILRVPATYNMLAPQPESENALRY